MSLLSRLLIVIILCLVSIALPAAPIGADDDGAYITLSPNSGVPGEEVRVRGYNFTADEWVDIYYYLNGSRTRIAEVETDKDGDFPWATFTVPESYTGPHEVFAEDEYDIDAYVDFTVEPGLTVDPEEGPVGTTVTVEGHGFAEDEEDIELRYYSDGASKFIEIEDDITADEDGWWEWSFQIPPSAQGSHKIDAQGDESKLYDVEDATFEVKPGVSIIDQASGNTIEEPSGSPGESITMTGNGFEADERDIKILFAGEEAETEPEIIRADEKGYWEASFQVPEMPKGEYSVTAEGEQTQDISELSFQVKPGIVLSPDEGHVGMNLTVTGRGFAASKNVVIKYDTSQKATTSTNAKGSFSGISFPVPESIHGAHQVTAEDTANNKATDLFTMESISPDTPDLISPPDGSRVGFTGKVRPTFEWSEVSDASGVYYHLQIATSENVTDTGEFVDPLVSKEDLVETSYTLEEADALSYGTYYWSVQAVDGAENESGWTAAYSFQAGLLPLWALIVIIVAIVVAIGALVYFFVIRRRIHYY